MKLYAALCKVLRKPLEKSSSGSFWWDRCLLYPFVRMEKGEFRNKDVQEIALKQYCVPADSQLISFHSCRTGTAGRFVYRKGTYIADINMGCPFP